jgi:hypothetical protein
MRPGSDKLFRTCIDMKSYESPQKTYVVSLTEYCPLIPSKLRGKVKNKQRTQKQATIPDKLARSINAYLNGYPDSPENLDRSVKSCKGKNV